MSVPPPSLSGAKVITWPVVALAFVREMPNTFMIAGGTVLGVTFIFHAPSEAWQPIASIAIPSVVSALARSRPEAGIGGLATFLIMALRGKMGF